MILSFFSRFKIIFVNFFEPTNIQGYGFTEFLINFEGGFVRRGLLGEVLLWITTHTGIHPHIIITAICLLSFGFVLSFFLLAFKKNGYCWWIVFSPLLCGFLVYFIRKDYLLYSVLIGMLWLVRDSDPILWKKLLAFALGILGLMLHEAFVFWGIALFALVLFTDRNQRPLNILLIAGLMVLFMLLCIFKGDQFIAQSIIDSWNSLLPGEPLELIHDDSIGALTWQLKETMFFHIKQNTGGYSHSYLGVIYWPMCLMVVYYFITFFFSVFKPKRSTFGVAERTQLSSLFLIVVICLLPMSMVLSCDYGRLFQYAAITSFAAFLILKDDVKQRIIPKTIQMKVAGFNNLLTRLVHPNKGLLVILLFFIGISPSSFHLDSSLAQSPIGYIWQAFAKTLVQALHYLQTWY